MKRLILVAAAALTLGASVAMAQSAVQPVTLSAQEYQAVLAALADRDPIMALLIRRQTEAQAAAHTPPSAMPTPPVPPPAPKP